MSVIIEVTDNADNEDGRRLQRSTDGGSTWTTVDAVSPGVTTLEDTNPPTYEFVHYRTQVYTEHVVSNSTTIRTVPVEENGVHIELTRGNSTQIIGVSDINTIDISPEHTGIWGAQITVAPGSFSSVDYALHDTVVYYEDNRLFDGQTRNVSFDSEKSIFRGYGKAIRLEEDTEFVTYPDAINPTSGVPIHDAISDYWSRTPANATVRDYNAKTVRSDEKYYYVPDASDFLNVTSIDDDEPLNVQPNFVELTQTCWLTEAEDGSFGGTVIDTVDSPSDLSDFEGVELSAGGNYAEISFTPQHDFPFSDFLPRFRYEYENFDGFIYFEIDNQRIGLEAVGGPATSGQSWGGNISYGAAGTVSSDPFSTFKAGQTYDLRIELDSGEYSGGRVIVDCIAPIDSGDRFVGWSYNFDNSPDMADSAQLDGPELYPDYYDVEVTANEIWHVPSATINSTWDNTSNNQYVALSVDGNNYVINNNSTTVTADFDAQGVYGTQAIARLRISRDDRGSNLDSPANGDSTQVLSGFELFVDTDDLPIITPDTPITLDGDTYLENQQTLHEEGDFRFTMDHSVDGVVVESYRRGDDDVVKSATWTPTEDGVDYERDTLDYANRLRGTGDGVDTEILMTSEINDKGEVLGSVAFPDISTRSTLDTKIRQEAIKASNNDEISGSIEIAPKYVEPGYPYNVPEFDGKKANLNGVSFTIGGRNATGTLEFGRRRTLTAKLVERT